MSARKIFAPSLRAPRAGRERTQPHIYKRNFRLYMCFIRRDSFLFVGQGRIGNNEAAAKRSRHMRVTIDINKEVRSRNTCINVCSPVIGINNDCVGIQRGKIQLGAELSVHTSQRTYLAVGNNDDVVCKVLVELVKYALNSPVGHIAGNRRVDGRCNACQISRIKRDTGNDLTIDNLVNVDCQVDADA